MKSISSKGKVFLKTPLKLTDNSLYCKLALSLVPHISSCLSKDTIDNIRGRLRRGDLSALQHVDILALLQNARSGDVLISSKLFSRVYQFNTLFGKLPPNESNDSQDVAALKVFANGEKRCAITNRFLSRKVFPTDSIHWEIRDLIHEILGDLPVDFLNQEVSFGPGTTVNPLARKISETSEFFKLSDPLFVTEGCQAFLAAHMSYQPAWLNALGVHHHVNDGGCSRLQFEMEVFKNHFQIVSEQEPNRLGFVPKKTDVSRTIGVELNGQVILQQCMGRLIRKRLKFFGLNLNTQSRNQHLARLAKTFGLATIDVENASNTLSIETVRSLIPRDWFCVLDAMRAKRGANKKHNYTKHYSMFSSMGNGFTFELESLIFYAIAVCVSRRITGKFDKQQVAVYGDDIIVPKECFDPMQVMLRVYGFRVNVEKSFSEGLFFESCGADFFDSVAVRPYYVRRHVRTVRDAYFLCNSLLFKCIKAQDNFLFSAYLILWQLIPNDHKLLGPLHFEVGKKEYWSVSTDDLESCLRVPLSFAQKNGAVKFKLDTFSYEYKTFRFVSPVVPLSLSHSYSVQNILYLMFLRAKRKPKVVLRGHSMPRLAKAITSRWDGLQTVGEARMTSDFFDGIPCFVR